MKTWLIELLRKGWTWRENYELALCSCERAAQRLHRQEKWFDWLSWINTGGIYRKSLRYHSSIWNKLQVAWLQLVKDRYLSYVYNFFTHTLSFTSMQCSCCRSFARKITDQQLVVTYKNLRTPRSLIVDVYMTSDVTEVHAWWCIVRDTQGKWDTFALLYKSLNLIKGSFMTIHCTLNHICVILQTTFDNYEGCFWRIGRSQVHASVALLSTNVHASPAYETPKWILWIWKCSFCSFCCHVDRIS